MHKLKRIAAIALAATMVIGSSITVLADEPATTGDSTGAGASEGHVDKKKIDVVLPTIASGETPFAYTMDPEGLIAETEGAKYGSTVEFPTSNDTKVYWNNGQKGGQGSDATNILYANSSKAQTVTNKSSDDISLTVTAEVTNPTVATNIPLVAKDEILTATAASLYLGLVVGSENPVALASDTAATKTVTIAGTPGNFKTAYNSTDSAYEYRALTLDEYKAISGNESKTQDDYDATWKNTTIQLEGATTTGKTIASTTTAPTVKVTWSWVDPSATPAPTAGYAEYDSQSNAFWFGTSSSAGFEAGKTASSVTIDGIDVTSKVNMTTYSGSDWIVVTWADAASLGLQARSSGEDYEIVFVVDGTTYNATFTEQ